MYYTVQDASCWNTAHMAQTAAFQVPQDSTFPGDICLTLQSGSWTLPSVDAARRGAVWTAGGHGGHNVQLTGHLPRYGPVWSVV